MKTENPVRPPSLFEVRRAACCWLAQGMFDEQLEHLMVVLKKNRIWAVNIGENFQVRMLSRAAVRVRHPSGLGAVVKMIVLHDPCAALRVQPPFVNP